MSQLIPTPSGAMRLIQCGTCGVWHAFPDTIYDSAYREGGFWHCPNGHRRGWTNGADNEELAKLRLERDRLTQNAAYLESRIREEVDRADAERRKRQQAEKRAGAGVCPCCTRTFSQLARHMQTKHPDVPFVPAVKVDKRKRVRA